MYEIGNDVEALKDDTGELLESTVRTARKRYNEAVDALEDVIERGKSMYGVARQRAVHDTKLVDRSIHEHVYQTIAIGIGIGVILGYVLSRPRD